MSAVQEQDGQIDPGGLFRRGFNHGAQSVKEAHGEGGDMVGVGLGLLLVNHVPHHQPRIYIQRPALRPPRKIGEEHSAAKTRIVVFAS